MLKAEGRADSYVYALHARLAQLFSDAAHDGIIARNPCSRRTCPGTGTQRPYVATTEQVWALHDHCPPNIRPAILLAAHAGLRLAEAAALRPEDVDFMRCVISPVIQWPDQPLKSDISRTPIPIASELALVLARAVAVCKGETIVTNPDGGRLSGPWAIQRAFRAACEQVEGLPDGFRFHDLRHYYASLLISSGLDVKVVQARVRHASGKTTLDTYGHLWPDRDDASRAAVAAVYETRRTPSAGFVDG
jgi:integrase